MNASGRSFDVAVIGAGPIGSAAALAHARRGARVLLLEANQRACQRLAGEWLHPPALEMLRQLGIELPARAPAYDTGRGFAVFPDTGDESVLLSYPGEALGYSCEHAALVAALREAAASHPEILYIGDARVTAIEGQRLRFARKGSRPSVAVSAGRIVGADGRSSVARAALGLSEPRAHGSRMAGVLLVDVELPFEGFGHVFLGGPGPVLAYRVGPDRVRLCLDLRGLALRPCDRALRLWESYAAALPVSLRAGFRDALREDRILWASVPVRPRSHYGRPGLVLVGDAVGHHHPLTAAGLTLGFGDALCLAGSESFRRYRRRRRRESRVPELLALALYDVLADDREDNLTMRHALIRLWRSSPRERSRSMGYLGCQDRRLGAFWRSFLHTALLAIGELGSRARASGQWQRELGVARALTSRVAWLSGELLRPESPRAFDGHAVGDRGNGRPADGGSQPAADPKGGLARAVRALHRHQRESGAWEGEVAWCPMLAAQYVMMCHVTGIEIPRRRREWLLLHFRRTRLAGGLWGLHAVSEPYLFVTTLVYVAARLLGLAPSDPLLAEARRLFEREGGVTAIPSWGKFWLAMLGLYEWRGVNPVLPELWRLPTWLPIHPSKFYCHTRLIYLSMGVIFARKLQTPPSERVCALREELYPQGYSAVDFRRARRQLRAAEIQTPPSRALRAIFTLSSWYDRAHNARFRRHVLTQLLERIRWELSSSSFTSISPVSGLLNMIALWSEDPDDPDLKLARDRFEGWFWEDSRDGSRIAGARSASWDSAFAVQALSAAVPQLQGDEALDRGVAFLRTQQIRESFPGFREAFRIDPRGGYCFAGVWHGWPVSDCTAEALIALMRADPMLDPEALREGARFMLRCQNPDGGFGSYEAQRTSLDLERINPAEMFGDSMSDHSWVECTASCAEALAATARRLGSERIAREAETAVRRARGWLLRMQAADGSWEGAWGVNFVYGTMFAVRGLVASGLDPGHPSIRRACRFLLERQRPDGGWGEDPRGCRTGCYTEHQQSQIVHTAWALMALLWGRAPESESIERAARFLLEAQQADGEWPRQDPAGVFFQSALLDYALYRRYFPLWALGLYQRRRAEQAEAWSRPGRAAARNRANPAPSGSPPSDSDSRLAV